MLKLKTLSLETPDTVTLHTQPEQIQAKGSVRQQLWNKSFIQDSRAPTWC